MRYGDLTVRNPKKWLFDQLPSRDRCVAANSALPAHLFSPTRFWIIHSRARVLRLLILSSDFSSHRQQTPEHPEYISLIVPLLSALLRHVIGTSTIAKSYFVGCIKCKTITVDTEGVP
ncbi:MAG: hypothetical protein WCB91_08230 [Halobacteriota archaeon]